MCYFYTTCGLFTVKLSARQGYRQRELAARPGVFELLAKLLWKLGILASVFFQINRLSLQL